MSASLTRAGPLALTIETTADRYALVASRGETVLAACDALSSRMLDCEIFAALDRVLTEAQVSLEQLDRADRKTKGTTTMNDAIERLRESMTDTIAEGMPEGRDWAMKAATHAQLGRMPAYGTRIRSQLAGEQVQQGGLAGAVWPHEPGPAGLELKVAVVKDRRGRAVRERHAGERDGVITHGLGRWYEGQGRDEQREKE